ncbi:helix-turn-helix domain-containing protein [Corallococcus sicarius]|nr:helix-turn-helix domain-containing protein [Corallococcus sicarius]
MEGAKGNRSEATRRLDISRATLHDKLRKVRARRRGRGRRLSLTAHG